MRILPRRLVALLGSLGIVGCSAVLGINEIPLAGDFPVNANGRNCPQLESDLISATSTVCPACVEQGRMITSFTCVPAMTASQQVSATCTCPAPDSGGPGGSGGSNGTVGILPDGAPGGSGGSGGGMGIGADDGGGSHGGEGGNGSGGSGGNVCDAGFGASGPIVMGDSGLSCKTNPVTCAVSCSPIPAGTPGK